MESDGYGGIFDGAGAAAPAAYSCSIPFLDIPPSSHCSDSQIIDYSEIFGGSNGAGYFALFDYEELIRVSKKKAEESSDSSNARISTEAKLSPQFEETSLFPEEASQNLGDHSMKNNSSPSSNHNNDASKKIRMSYHRLSHDSREDIISEKTHLTQLQAIPGYSHVIDSCSSLANVQHGSSVQIQTSDLIHRVSSDGRINNAELGKEELHTSFTDNTKSYKDDMNTNQKDFKTKLKHHSRSSSSYSTSSVDFSDPSVTYVSAYDINLRTKLSNIPPPSRAPPKLYTKQDNTEMKTSRSSNGDQEGNTLKPVPNQIHYRVGVSKSGRFFREAKDTTSRFIDADEDASSAAAAMKEAMEQAQAKLRSAKELMEREQNNLQSRKKLGHEETIEYNEMEIQTPEKGKIFHDEITKKCLLKNRKGMKKYALDDTKNVMTTEEKERYVVTTEESQPLREGNGFKSCHRPYKSEELYREQKTEKQYYELANNEKFRVVKEAFKHDGVQRKPKTARDFGDDRLEGNENVERSDDNSIAGNITLKEDIVEIPNSFLGTCFVKENVNKLEEYHSFNQQYKNEKVKADQEVLFSEQKLKAQYSSENMSMWGVKQKNDEFSGDALKLEEIYQDNKEDGNSQVAEEACLLAVSAKKLSGTNLTSSSESEEKSNVNLLDNHQSSYKQNECKLEGTVSASEQKESRKLDGESMQVEKNLGSNLPQDENEMKESSEITKKMKSTQETWPDYAETIEAIWERLQNKEKVNASKVLSVKKNTAKPIDSEDRESKEGNEALCTPQTFVPDVHKTERVEKEGTIGVDREFEKETARKIEEEKERKREREKDRATVEKAPHEAHECALSEARERFERIAVERGTAEVQQRALAEKLKEAKLRAERAAVERELAEARERAVKKALDEIAAADAWKRAEKLSATSREKGRKENESGDFFRACLGEVTETRLKAGPSDVLHDAKFLNAGSSSSSQRHADSYPHGEVESPLRFKARLERRQRTSDRAAKALAEKNMHDVLVQREQAERNRFAESLDGEIRRWATGKEGNLRALLSTLQYILGPESGWQPIPLTDVITAAAVKKAYRKATLCVHPDKLQQRGANIQQKYICEKVFDLLKDAWSQFNSEER